MDKSWQAPSANWRLLDPRLFAALRASNRPEWLKQLFERSANSLGLKLHEVSDSGSDELAFTQAGVVATTLSLGGNPTHCPGDTIDRVRKESLATAGRLAASVLATVVAEPVPARLGNVGTAKNDRDAISGRIAATVADIAASADPSHRRRALLKRLDELQATYRLEGFCFGTNWGTNVLVEPLHAGTKRVLVGAHYDCVPAGKGVVDNGAGVAAVLELLSAVKAKPLKNLAFGAAFFDLEEIGERGAKAYVAARSERGALPWLYVNLDVFAYGDTFCVAA
jgi:hypothetical protein